MTRSALLALALAGLACRPAPAQTDASVVPDDAPDWRPMGDAIAAARTDSTLVLVHAYAVWCGWCSRLDRDVYTDDGVQAYLAEHFEPTRLDIESADSVAFFNGPATMRRLAETFGVSGTPTTVFFDGEGTYLTRLPGFAPPETFLLVLRYVREGAYEAESFEEFRTRVEGGPPVAPTGPALPVQGEGG